MVTIGRFTKDEADYVGAISTLTFQSGHVRIVAELNRMTESPPSHRVFAGETEIGVAWPKRDKAGNEYLNLKLDDPAFSGPIYPTLVQGPHGQSFVLVWSRSNSTRS